MTNNDVVETYRYIRLDANPNEYPTVAMKFRIDNINDHLMVAFALCSDEDSNKFSKKVAQDLTTERLENKTPGFYFEMPYNRNLSLKDNFICGLADQIDIEARNNNQAQKNLFQKVFFTAFFLQMTNQHSNITQKIEDELNFFGRIIFALPMPIFSFVMDYFFSKSGRYKWLFN